MVAQPSFIQFHEHVPEHSQSLPLCLPLFAFFEWWLQAATWDISEVSWAEKAPTCQTALSRKSLAMEMEPVAGAD
jgi:hypothetical protein